jgi:hypothetical protein
LIDAEDLDEAIGIAARVPVANVGTIEIRPILEIPGLPEKYVVKPVNNQGGRNA